MRVSQRSEIFWREKETFDARTRSERQRSEEEWERWFIRKLREIGWTFRNDLKNEEKQTSEEKLTECLLGQIQRFYVEKNNLSDSFEFTRKEKIQILQELNSFKSRDLSKPIELNTFSEGITRKLQVPLIDLENIENNKFWLVQQVKERKRRFTHIYDLVLLINGIPLVCIELKKATISTNEALTQLKNYEQDRFINQPSSIFNNFQLFVALNFQKLYLLRKEEIMKVNINHLRNNDCLCIYLDYWFEEKIKYFFTPSRVLQKIFQLKIIDQPKYVTRSSQTEQEIENIQVIGATSLSTPQNFKVFESLGKFSKLWLSLFLCAFFLLINFLSGWAWWTILLGFLPTFMWWKMCVIKTQKTTRYGNR